MYQNSLNLVLYDNYYHCLMVDLYFFFDQDVFFIYLDVCQRAHVDRFLNPLLFHLLTSIAMIKTADEFL